MYYENRTLVHDLKNQIQRVDYDVQYGMTYMGKKLLEMFIKQKHRTPYKKLLMLRLSRVLRTLRG